MLFLGEAFEKEKSTFAKENCLLSFCAQQYLSSFSTLLILNFNLNRDVRGSEIGKYHALSRIRKDTGKSDKYDGMGHYVNSQSTLIFCLQSTTIN